MASCHASSGALRSSLVYDWRSALYFRLVMLYLTLLAITTRALEASGLYSQLALLPAVAHPGTLFCLPDSGTPGDQDPF